MAGLQITITDAGRAALPNGPNTGTSAVTISHVGVSSVHTTGSLKSLTALPGEVKRVTTFGGDIVADDVIHVTINDETSDVYSVRAFGLYLSTGVLFAVFSSQDVVVEKSAGAMVLLSADITFKTLDTAVIQFGGTGFINPPATTERLGVVELATWEESAAGNRADVVVTPFGLLKTLQSWATNFAAAVHRHAMTAIDGLPEALASKSAVGHKHDASDTTSGVFDVGRIPALGMERITGLAIALANRAALIHGHVMSDIDGLVQALNGKSAVGHKHDASDTNSGTFEVGRIPALAMEKITGLAVAFSQKASLFASVTFADVRVFDGNGAGVVYFGDLSHFLLFDGVNYVLPNAPLISAGGTVWTSATFNPATKANATNPVFYGELVLSAADVRFRAANAGGALYLQAGTDSSNSGRMRLTGLLGVDLTELSVQMGGSLREIYHAGNFDPNSRVPITRAHATNPNTAPIGVSSGDANLGNGLQGWHFFTSRRGGSGWGVQTAITDTDSSEQFRFRRSDVDGSWGPWRTVWTTVNFNPATKVQIYNPDNFPHDISLGWNGERFVGRVDNAVAHSLVHMGDGASAAETQIGAAADRFVTPAALWSFARNLGSPGYAVIPGTGLMLQWGISVGNIPEGETHAVLPVAFGGGCLIALANPRNPGRNINSDFYMQVVGHFADRIAFFANRANGSAGNVDGFEWVALGRVSGGTPDPAYSSGGSGGIGGGGGGGGQIEV